METMELWGKVCRPPKTALSQIKGGRLSGMTDIKPQWRYKVMTEIFGPCGIGWKYVTKKKWTVGVTGEQIIAFVDIDLFIKEDGKWSDPIEGTGGSMLVVKETKGLHVSDEAFKMATTDALSAAMKMIGVGADVYIGQFNGTKYTQESSAPKKKYADYVEEIDKLDSVALVNSWLASNWASVESSLDNTGIDKLKKYAVQVREVFENAENNDK